MTNADDHEPHVGSAHRRPPRRGWHILLGAVLGAVLVLPSAVLAADRFGDTVPSVHRDGVGFVADTGVTAGCGDGSDYCPDEPVTRAQMATFMHRLAGHADGVDPSVDAATVQGIPGPVAFGRVGADGSTSSLAGSDNFSATFNETLLRYEIRIDDVNFSTFRNTAVVAPIQCIDTTPFFVTFRIASRAGTLGVQFEDGERCSFSFIAY